MLISIETTIVQPLRLKRKTKLAINKDMLIFGR